MTRDKKDSGQDIPGASDEPSLDEAMRVADRATTTDGAEVARPVIGASDPVESAGQPVKPGTIASCRVVAIGASAGGLEPFEQFFDNIRVDMGLAYVVIQHLSPDFRSMMDELLNRRSAMKISRVEDGMAVEANTIYLNVPRVHMTIANGKFVLKPVSSRDALHLPINTFMESLAEEQGEKAIAIILSGTGSDGTIGAAAIQDVGGTVLVQEPETAKFDGMPNSVIEALTPDAIAPPKGLARIISRLADGEPVAHVPREVVETDPKERVFQLLRERFGADFSHYKNATIDRRLQRRVELLGFDSLDEYASKMANDMDEADALYGDFLIEVTEFFRDEQAFEALSKKVITKLVEKMSADRQIRVWIPGCASGQEAYSIAIALAEEALKANIIPNVKILATDIHHRSLEAANLAVYDKSDVRRIPKELRDRYFEFNGNSYQVRPVLRQMVVFSVHNILRDPPFTKIDLVSCRNLLIYLNGSAQQKALAYFHFSLSKGGYIFLGPSETVGELSNEFELLDQRWRIFEKRRDVRLIESMTQLPRVKHTARPAAAAVLSSFVGDKPIVRSDAKRVYERSLDMLLKRYAPPGFLLKRSGEVVRVFGDAGRFINIAEGNFSQRIDDLVRGDLRVVVSAALDRARTPSSLPFERKIRVRGEANEQSNFVIALEAIGDRREDDDLMLLTIIEQNETIRIPDFDDLDVQAEDIETVTLLRQRIEDLEHELQGSEETLQTTVEELETSNEELQATNEELMASNEELQSTNEELHSVNEELYTVSAEHQRKIIELTEMSSDMEHLLQATGIGTIFVDSDLKVRRFTPAAVQAFNILDQDIGRPIGHITNRFGDPHLTETLWSTVETGESVEREVKLGDSVMLLRALPYVASPGEVSGAVLTMVDVTELKRAQVDAQTLATRYEGIVKDIGHFMLRWRAEDEKVTFCNEASIELFGSRREDILNRPLSAIIPSKQNQEFKAQIGRMKPGEALPFLLNMGEEKGRPRWFEGTVRKIADGDGVLREYQAIGQDISDATGYRIALEKLSQLHLDAEAPLRESLVSALEIGVEFLDMPLGVFSRIEGKKFTVESVVGGDLLGFHSGKVLDLDQSFVGELASKNKAVCIPHISESEFRNHEAYRKTGLESFIGQRIDIEMGQTGAVNFASRSERGSEFTDLHRSFIQTLSEWMGRRVERDTLMRGIERTRGDLSMILDNIRAKVWIKDSHNKILRLNNAAAEAMGLTVEAATGGDTYELFPEMAKKYHEDDLEVISSGKPRKHIVERFTPKGGDLAWVETDKIPFVHQESGEANLLVIAMDITRQKEQEQRVFDLNDELSAKNERLLATNDSLKQFAHVASHDLQEPLRKLMQFTEYLVDDCGDEMSEDGRYFVDVISSSAERMRQLVQDILALSTASGKEMNVKPIDLGELLRELWSEFDVTAAEANAKFVVGDMPEVTGDATLVQQLFRNLMSNGLKYRNKGVAPKIEISSKKWNEGVEITVRDNGIGMAPEDAARIFEPFARLHNRKEFDGTGIGLAICRTVCERHGWNISVSSAVGDGAAFSIRIREVNRIGHDNADK